MVALALLIGLAHFGWAAADPISLPYLMQKEFDGRDLKLIKVLEKNPAYTKYYVTYKSGELTISGIMDVPKGKGPFPVVITAHGFIRPEYYVTGRGLKREQDHLARHGYVVLHPDYRNHAGSSKDPNNDLKLHIGYIEDVINAVYAIKNSPLSYLDKENIGMLGHSLGGGLALGVMVTKPDLIKAYVLFAPMSINYRDNFYRWTLRSRGPDRGHRATALKIIEKYGSPEANPEFWDNLSPQTFLDRVRSPVMVHHGTNDDSVPLDWSEKLVKAFEEHGKDITFYVYEGERHEFIKQWPLVMKRTVGFFDPLLKR